MGLRLGVLGLESNHQSNLVYDKSSGMTSSHVNTEFCPWYLVDLLVFVLFCLGSSVHLKAMCLPL